MLHCSQMRSKEGYVLRADTYGVLAERLDERGGGFEVGFEVRHGGRIFGHEKKGNDSMSSSVDDIPSVWRGKLPSDVSLPVVSGSS